MRVVVVQGACPASGTYPFTDSSAAAPNSDLVGALFWEGISTTSANVASMRFSFGATDLTNNLSLGLAGQDANAGATGQSSLSLANCLSMPSTSGSSGVTTAPIAAFGSALSNGISLNPSSYSTGRLTNCLLLSGTDVEMECGSVQFAAGDTNKTIAFSRLGGKADLIILLTSMEQTGGDTTGVGAAIGWYERTGGNMASNSFRFTSGANPTDLIGWCSSNSTAELMSATVSLAHQTVDTFTASGFRIHLSANPGVASLVGWIAIRGKSQQLNTQSSVAALPTATGNTALISNMVAPGPTCVLAMPGRFTTKDAIQHNDTAGHFGLCVATTPDRSATTQAASTTTFQYNVATSVAHNKNTLNRFLSTQDDAGADVIVSTVNAWVSTAPNAAGITVNYSAVNASTIQCPVLAFGLPTTYAEGPFTYTGGAATFTTTYNTNPVLVAAAGTYDVTLAPVSSDVEFGLDFTTYQYTGSVAFLTPTISPVALTADAGFYSWNTKTAQLVAVIPSPPIAPPVVYPFNPLVWTADNPMINASGSPGVWTNTQQVPFHPCTADGWWGGPFGVNSIYPKTVGVPGSLGKNVTSRTFSWNEMARRAWGSEFSAPDHRVYVWSNGRAFDSTDMGSTGFYKKP